MDNDDPLAEMRLAAQIEDARARQDEGKARVAEAVERELAGARSERREERAAADHRRRLSGFMQPSPSRTPIDVIVLESRVEGEER